MTIAGDLVALARHRRARTALRRIHHQVVHDLTRQPSGRTLPRPGPRATRRGGTTRRVA